ncbi:MAG: hypothetical protein NDI61_13945 [Bdellovibrionaceae bacterium]|nr:hypothetical protein [Pseudobdellovibrionaceae bacterium]
MKKIMFLMLIAVMGLGTGCGGKNKKAPITNAEGRQGRSGGDGVSTSTDITLNGGIYQGQDSSSEEFQDVLRGFVNAVIPEDYLGFVNGDFYTDDSRTGFVFGGKVYAQSGRITQAGSSGRVAITANSRMLMLIYDEFVGTTDPSGKTVPPIPTFLTSASGYVEGNHAYLKFWDSRGWVTLDGTFQPNGDFHANVAYDNQVRYDGQGAGGAGDIGFAVIRSCSFFVCN